MKNMMRISVIALVMIAHGGCSGMMTVFKKNNSNSSQRLSNDSLISVAHQSPMATKLNIRATCRELEKNIKIDELEDTYPGLKGKRKFYIDIDELIRDRYLNPSFTRNRADELGWNYHQSAFSADGALVIDPKYGIDRQLYMDAYNHLNENDVQVLEQDYTDLKRVFSLGHKLGDHEALKNIMLTHVPNNRYGLKHVFGMGIVRKAIFRKDWDFAKALVETNPHGFCSRRGHELANDHIRSSYYSEGGIEPNDKNLLALVELAKSQPRYHQKQHEHCTIL